MIRVLIQPLQVAYVAFSYPTQGGAGRVTMCEIFEGGLDTPVEKMTLVTSQLIKQYFKDFPWSKDQCRKAALTRALKFTSFNRFERKLIWLAYFDRGQISSRPPTPSTPTEAKVIMHPSSIKAFGLHDMDDACLLSARCASPMIH